MRAVLALAVIVLVTGVFGMSQISQAVISKTKLTKTRLVNQMGDKLEYLKERIKNHEARGGAVILPYQLEYEDANGKTIKENFLTGGYGHKILKGETHPNMNYTEEYWDGVFDKDFAKAYDGALKLVGKDTNGEAIGIITEMIFQMGYEGVSKFEKTLEYIKNEQWELASTEMLDSNWAIQTPKRADELSKLMAKIQ
jgi:hypothetical protein